MCFPTAEDADVVWKHKKQQKSLSLLNQRPIKAAVVTGCYLLKADCH